MALHWICEAGEPGRNKRPTWMAQIGPVRIVAQQYKASDVPYWTVHLEGAGEREEMTGPTPLTNGEAMEAAEPWALTTLREWAERGELARAALAAMEGQQ